MPQPQYVGPPALCAACFAQEIHQHKPTPPLPCPALPCPALHKQRCVDCPSNATAPAGSTQCTVCGAREVPSEQRDSCVCNVGYAFKLGKGSNATTCVECGPGTAATEPNSAFCSACPVGTYSVPNGTRCEDCAVGAAAKLGSSSCIHCGETAVSHFVVSDDRSTCECLEGHHLSLAAGPDVGPSGEGCVACPSGWVQPLRNSFSCIPCGVGTFPNEAATACER